MITTAASIVTDPVLVTAAVHLVHDLWAHMPAITEGLRAVAAGLGVVAGVHALRHNRCRRCQRYRSAKKRR